MHTTYILERDRGVVGVGRQTTCTRSTGRNGSHHNRHSHGGREDSLRKRYMKSLEVP